MKWNKLALTLAITVAITGTGFASTASPVSAGTAEGTASGLGLVSSVSAEVNTKKSFASPISAGATTEAALKSPAIKDKAIPISKAPYNEHVFNTVDGQAITLPMGVKTRDLKHVAMSKGYTDVQGVFHRTEAVTGDALATGLTPAEYNQIMAEGIRDLAGADKLNIPELQHFNAPIWRDWNVHQWTKSDMKGWHSAYVVEFALTPHYLEYGKALSQLEEKGKAQAKPGEPFNLQAALTENLEARVVSQNLGPKEAEKYIQQRQEWRHFLSNVQNLNTHWVEELGAQAKDYEPVTYSPAGEYARLAEAVKKHAQSHTAESMNERIRTYKAELLTAVAKDLKVGDRYLGPKTVRPYKVEVAAEKQVDTIVKFFMNSNIIVDSSKEQLVTTTLGQGYYNEIRFATVIDGFEIPMTYFGFLYFTEGGPVMSSVVINDSDYAIWQPIVKDVWGIK
ncbi:hypothetical protein [uncultured Veillonella sp.]|uniref:hypothetical protein n=1 Tax=uncultured Veillonella sp. TaxID=159268 RepID=UPI0026173EFB|nr:hypothetical protein [uncultured Veillonella sp.]